MVALLVGAERGHASRVPHCRIGRVGYRSWLLVVLVVVAVAHRRCPVSSLLSDESLMAAVTGVEE